MFDERSGPLRPDLTCARNTSNLRALRPNRSNCIRLRSDAIPTLFAFPEHLRKVCIKFVEIWFYIWRNILCTLIILLHSLPGKIKCSMYLSREPYMRYNNSCVCKKTSICPQCWIFIMLGVQVVGHAVIWLVPRWAGSPMLRKLCSIFFLKKAKSFL